MTEKLGDHLMKLCMWTRKELDRRAQRREVGMHEHFDLVTSLGKNAVLGAGVWVGHERAQGGITMSGDLLEIDGDHPLTQIALEGAQHMRSFNQLTTLMDGKNSGFSREKADFLNLKLDGIAYQTGVEILKNPSLGT